MMKFHNIDLNQNFYHLSYIKTKYLLNVWMRYIGREFYLFFQSKLKMIELLILIQIIEYLFLNSIKTIIKLSMKLDNLIILTVKISQLID